MKETKEKVEKKGKDEGEKTTEKEKKEAEPNFEILQNPARVLRQQLKVIQLVEGSHYAPVKDIQIGGIVMVKHIQSDTEEELVEPVAGKSIRFKEIVALRWHRKWPFSFWENRFIITFISVFIYKLSYVLGKRN